MLPVTPLTGALLGVVALACAVAAVLTQRRFRPASASAAAWRNARARDVVLGLVVVAVVGALLSSTILLSTLSTRGA